MSPKGLTVKNVTNNKEGITLMDKWTKMEKNYKLIIIM